MDWNWFFSSVAQSVAALVGIFAAFVITKIVNSQAEFSRKATRIRELLSTSDKHKDAADLRYFRWFSDRTLEYAIKSLKEVLSEEKAVQTPEDYYHRIAFPKYVPRSEILERIEELFPQPIPEAPADDEKLQMRHSSASDVFNRTIAYQPKTETLIYQATQRERLRDSVDTEETNIENLLLEIRQHIRLVKLSLSEVEDNPESSRLVSFSIACAVLLFFVGVIYPLSFLPSHERLSISINAFFPMLFSLKGGILAVVSVIFSVIMAVFWRVNSSLRFDKDELLKLREVAEVKYYSTYFEIREKNALEHNKWLQQKSANDA